MIDADDSLKAASDEQVEMTAHEMVKVARTSLVILVHDALLELRADPAAGQRVSTNFAVNDACDALGVTRDELLPETSPHDPA
jgi:hypothetical protein